MSKSFLKMSPAEREVDLARFENGISFEQTKPLSAQARGMWELAKRSRGRPRKPRHQKAVRFLISMEPSLLAAVEAFAAANHLDRSRLIALSLRAFLASDAAHQEAARPRAPKKRAG
jgi:hypothetical protein